MLPFMDFEAMGRGVMDQLEDTGLDALVNSSRSAFFLDDARAIPATKPQKSSRNKVLQRLCVQFLLQSTEKRQRFHRGKERGVVGSGIGGERWTRKMWVKGASSPSAGSTGKLAPLHPAPSVSLHLLPRISSWRLFAFRGPIIAQGCHDARRTAHEAGPGGAHAKPK
jgi:hypothetical protein